MDEFVYLPKDAKICGNCLNWILNGGVLRYGYCRVNSMTHRRYNDNCKGAYGTKSYKFIFNPHYYCLLPF